MKNVKKTYKKSRHYIQYSKQLSIDTNVIRYLTVKYDKIDLKNEFFGSKK